MEYILIGSQRKRSDEVYYNDLVESFKGRIPYSDVIYEETAFQWLGPIVIMFKKSIDFETRFVRAHWLNINGDLGTTTCRVGDSWGYHSGSVWHKVRENEEEAEAFRVFVGSPENDDVVTRYLRCSDWVVNGMKDYMKLVRKEWKIRSMKNLKRFVSTEENRLKLQLERKLIGE